MHRGGAGVSQGANDDNLEVRPAGAPFAISRAQLVALAAGQDPLLLARLLALECTCKSKTALLVGEQLTLSQLVQKS